MSFIIAKRQRLQIKSFPKDFATFYGTLSISYIYEMYKKSRKTSLPKTFIITFFN